MKIIDMAQTKGTGNISCAFCLPDTLFDGIDLEEEMKAVERFKHLFYDDDKDD